MNGFLNINKPPDWTSHDVVAKVRGLLGQAKVGHTGTLDPMATGVLPLCVGHATKVAQYLVDADKEYRVVMRLGATTDTQDATGRGLTRTEARPGAEDIVRVLRGLGGAPAPAPPDVSRGQGPRGAALQGRPRGPRGRATAAHGANHPARRAGDRRRRRHVRRRVLQGHLRANAVRGGRRAPRRGRPSSGARSPARGTGCDRG